jgi:hypothetical protein
VNELIGDNRLVRTREAVERGVLGVGIVSVEVELSYGLVMLAVDVGVGEGNKVEDSVGVGETLNDDIISTEEVMTDDVNEVTVVV